MLMGERLIYVIHTPIPTGPTYNIFKFTPIPMKGWTKYYMYDNISPKPIAISSDATEYIIIDVKKCTSLEFVRICEIVNPIHRLVTESSCYSHLLKDKKDTDCTKKYFDLNNNFILALENRYSWYILPQNSETITLTCGINFETTFTIKEAVILEIAPHCRGRSEKHLFLPRGHTNSSEIYEFKINVSFTSLEKHALTAPEITLPEFNSYHIDTHEIITAADSLDDLSQKLEIISQNHTKNHWLNTGYSILNKIIYSLAGIAIIYIMYRIRVFHALWNILKWV